MLPLPGYRVVRLLAELKAAARGFTWESAVWAESGRRRSPYRALVLFGLSARTRDALLADMCRRFFRVFPDAAALAAWRPAQDGGFAAGEARGIVRPGQLPVIASMADALTAGVPRERDGLLRIHGVGEKIAECVLAYGWGEEALPLDAHGVRVLSRVFGLGDRERTPAPLREGLKWVYHSQIKRFAALSIAMVDIHEILRLHGQLCCSRTPQCRRCPVSGCQSRRQPADEPASVELDPTIWDDWRELLYEPDAV